ncbi:MAG: 2'-5' RNA ligase family protein, partial [Thermomicrobiales bacterium]
WRRRLRHPLSWLPDIPVEQVEAYRRIWENFQQADEVEDGRHDTEDWRARNTTFALCCIRVPLGALNEEFDQVRDVLRGFPFVRLHPNAFLHIPIQELGFLSTEPHARDEINNAGLEGFCGVAQIPIAEFPSIRIKVTGINSFLDAPFLEITDGASLSRIQRRLLDITLVQPNTRYPYLPHITIGHYTEEEAIGDLAAAIAPWRDVVFGEFEVTEIDVVTFSTNEAYPALIEFQRLPLGTSSPTTPFVSGPGKGALVDPLESEESTVAHEPADHDHAN